MANLSKTEFKTLIDQLGPDKKKEIEELNGITIAPDGAITDSSSSTSEATTAPQAADEKVESGAVSVSVLPPIVTGKVKTKQTTVKLDCTKEEFLHQMLEEGCTISDYQMINFGKERLVIVDCKGVEEARQKVIAINNEITGIQKICLSKAQEIGGLLYFIKLRIKHGRFTRWFMENIQTMSLRTAQRYMLVYTYAELLDQEGIETLRDAYDYISGNPIGDEEDPIADDGTDTKPQFEVIRNEIELDTVKPPIKKKLVGRADTFLVTKELVERMENEEYPFDETSGQYMKLVVKLPKKIEESDNYLLARFVGAAAKQLKKGGKLIFLKK